MIRVLDSAGSTLVEWGRQQQQQVHGGYCVGQRNLEGRILLEFCLEKELCMSSIWTKREEKGMVTFRMGENETDIDFVLMKKERGIHGIHKM